MILEENYYIERKKNIIAANMNIALKLQTKELRDL